MYYNGEGVAVDYQKALELIKESYKQGYTPAKVNMGITYFHGQGVAGRIIQAA